MSDHPDPYSAQWYQRRFAGMVWHLNRADADYASAADLIEALTARVDSLETDMGDARAELGRQKEEFEAAMEKVRLAYRQLKENK